MNVSPNVRFNVAAGGYGNDAAPPLLPVPVWAPSPSLELDPAAQRLHLVFTEPSAWSRYPWHIPTGGEYVPAIGGTYPGRVADLARRDVVPGGSDPFGAAAKAWHGAGPWKWGYTLDGVFVETGVSSLGPGHETSITVEAGGYDWTLPHTFTLHLLYEDVPAYQWWIWDGGHVIAPKGTFVSPWWFYPVEKYRSTGFPVGYPADAPDYTDYAPWPDLPAEGFTVGYQGTQPILPPGLTSLDYGGLGRVEVPPQVLTEDMIQPTFLSFTLHQSPGAWLEVVSDPVTLLASAPAAAPVVVNGGSRTLAGAGSAVAPLSHADLAALWVFAGGLQQDADTAAAIAQAESGGCQYAKAGAVDDRPVKQCTYRFTTGENSYGLWQINRDAHPGYTAASLYTPLGNARAAVAIAGLPANFAPWSTYTSGAYKQYLTVPVSPVPPGTTEPPTAVQQIEPNVFRGYRDLRNSLARHLPTQLERSRQTGQVTLRLLARHRKVRR